MKVNMDKLAELDSHWSEVMELAVKYGFITQAYGGTATLATHKNQLEAYRAENYIICPSSSELQWGGGYSGLTRTFPVYTIR